jgi:hypothetical protein
LRTIEPEKNLLKLKEFEVIKKSVEEKILGNPIPTDI